MSKKSLVLYYSWSGNTRKIAELIARKTGADLRELQPENAYPQNYNNVLAQAKREIQGKWYPALRPIEMDWSAYETVYLGTPNWWSSIAPPVSSFFEPGHADRKGHRSLLHPRRWRCGTYCQRYCKILYRLRCTAAAGRSG